MHRAAPNEEDIAAYVEQQFRSGTWSLVVLRLESLDLLYRFRVGARSQVSYRLGWAWARLAIGFRRGGFGSFYRPSKRVPHALAWALSAAEI